MPRWKRSCSPTPARSRATAVRSSPTGRAIHRELKRKHVTLSILWDEYIARDPEGYRYSRFCELYRIWEGKLSVTMRQTHVGGDKLFVDYAGDTVPVIVDRLTGEMRQAQIFVAVMGASNFTYAEATWTQTLGDWIGAHTRALRSRSAACRSCIVPDNAKVAVIKACLYEPQVNRTYAEMAAHYGTAVLPTRPRRPRDKAKVEACVLIVERWLHRSAARSPVLQPGRTERGDRRAARAAQRGAADPPPRRHPPAAARRARPAGTSSPCRPSPTSLPNGALRRVGIDYHVEVEGHFYSVPYRFARSEVEVRLTGAHRRDLPQGRADRRASALQRQRQAHHRRRPHALQPSPLCRLDRRAHPQGRRRSSAPQPRRYAS